jgi:lipoprotein-releasing system ATP-binding protein
MAEHGKSSPVKTEPILRASSLTKTYVMGDSVVQVLTNLDLSIRPGEFVAIEGRSGSGKSTLLHLLGALDTPDAGTIEYAGTNIGELSSDGRSRMRIKHFGFVFQFYHLLPELSVIENALLGPMIEHSWFSFRAKHRELKERAGELLKQLGVDHRMKHKPSQLSGGERQRVAIARALMNEPRVLFTDEPTGNLDAETGRQIMGVLEKLHRDKGQTIIMVTHDRTIARQADRTLILKQGRLERPNEPAVATPVVTLDYQ